MRTLERVGDDGQAKPQRGASETCAGYTVRDALGHKLGSVEKLFVNGSGEPKYVRISRGTFGMKAFLLPVETAVVDDDGRTFTLR